MQRREAERECVLSRRYIEISISAYACTAELVDTPTLYKLACVVCTGAGIPHLHFITAEVRHCIGS